jgi:hypothetical protein
MVTHGRGVDARIDPAEEDAQIGRDDIAHELVRGGA